MGGWMGWWVGKQAEATVAMQPNEVSKDTQDPNYNRVHVQERGLGGRTHTLHWVHKHIYFYMHSIAHVPIYACIDTRACITLKSKP